MPNRKKGKAVENPHGNRDSDDSTSDGLNADSPSPTDSQREGSRFGEDSFNSALSGVQPSTSSDGMPNGQDTSSLDAPIVDTSIAAGELPTCVRGHLLESPSSTCSVCGENGDPILPGVSSKQPEADLKRLGDQAVARGPRWEIAVGVAVCVVVAIVIVVMTHSSSSSTNTQTGIGAQQSASSSGSGGTSGSGGSGSSSETSQASSIENVLNQSAQVRGSVINATQQIASCGDIQGAIDSLNTASSTRENLANQVQNLQVSSIPGGSQLVQDLSNALSSSSQSDSSYAQWGSDELGNCRPNDNGDSNFQDAQGTDQQATAAKQAFLNLWNPIASQFNLQTYTQDQI